MLPRLLCKHPLASSGAVDAWATPSALLSSTCLLAAKERLEYPSPHTAPIHRHHQHTAVKAEKRARKDASAYDPFRLVECGPASSEVVPFHVVMSTEAMVLMDVHAHLTNTEVIGLLGGRYDADTHTVEVRMAWPCDSQSTGLQCEVCSVVRVWDRKRTAICHAWGLRCKAARIGSYRGVVCVALRHPGSSVWDM